MIQYFSKQHSLFLVLFMSEKFSFEGFPSLLQISVTQWKLTATDVPFMEVPICGVQVDLHKTHT